VVNQCSKSLFPSTDKGKSQFPFYPFMTLHQLLSMSISVLICWNVNSQSIQKWMLIVESLKYAKHYYRELNDSLFNIRLLYYGRKDMY
jgi:hypothetical protein